MKKFLLSCLLALASLGAVAQTHHFPATDTDNVFTGSNTYTVGSKLGPVTFAHLPGNSSGRVVYCSDCQSVDPCLGSGTGALATSNGSAWSCSRGAGTGDAITIRSNPFGAGAISAAGQQYVVNAAGTGFELQARSIVSARDCSGMPFDKTTDATTATNSCIAAHHGAIIEFPKLSTADTAVADYVFAGRIALQGSQTELRGATGNCSMQIMNCVTFLFTSITGGMDVGAGNTCQGCSLKNLELRGSYPSSILVSTLSNNWVPCTPPASQTYNAGTVCVSTNDGLTISTPFVTLEHVIVGRFGKSCIKIDGNSVADNLNAIDVSVQGCHMDGLVNDGGDSNAHTFVNFHAYYNLAYGVDDSPFLGTAWYSPQATNNHIASATIGSTVNISSYSCNGTVCTVNTSGAHGMLAGNVLIAAGTSDDGTYFVASIPTTTQLTFALASSNTGAAAGTIRLASRNEFFAATGLAGGSYSYVSAISGVFIEAYSEGGQVCNFGGTAIVIGGVTATCPDSSGNLSGFHIGALTGLPGTISQNLLNVNNPNDTNLDMTIRSGTAGVGPRHAFFKFINNDLTTIFRVGQGQISSVDNFFINSGTTDPATSGCFGNCRLHIVAGGLTDISSQGTAAVRINPDNGSGSGGLEIYGGGSLHLLVGKIDGSGNANFKAGLTLQFITGSTQCLQVNTSGVVSGTGAVCGTGGGGGGITSIATSSPITGGTITTAGTISCPTCAVTGTGIGQFAATSSATLRGLISDESGTGALLFAGGALGAATATTINKITITQPASGATLTLIDGKTFTVNNTINLSGTNGVTGNITALNIRTCEIIIGDPGAASIALADDNDTPVACINDTAQTMSITAVKCYADAGTPTVTPIITGGGSTSILSGALTCGTGSYATGTLNGTPTQTAGQTIDANITAAGGTAKYIVIRISRTL